MEDSGRIRRIFDEASERSGDARRLYLDQECGPDAELRSRVEGLLLSAERDDEFLASPTEDSSAMAGTISRPLSEGPGTMIGPYKLLQQIGEGGFGAVFMAEQERPVHRIVALKIIKLGMDTHQVIARFEAERQALAMMDHPNIARVLDAGATQTGRPFFVMDLVKGEPIAEYCDKNNLTIQDRLRLFEQVCAAVQHAHTKGIIHRDLKPGNILVSSQDGQAMVKVIDFGIAKATASKLTEKTLYTEHRQLIGTPEYMSPEQAEGSMDIDTRTDVYSLGVLLYELLTGTTPFTSKELRSAAYGEIQRIIREVDPPNPSTRLSRSGETLAGVAARRHTEPRRLGAIVRGELDWIVMKALEKDRKRRYDSASGLGMDVGRYLAGHAVLAAPPGAVYRTKKFVTRHLGVVAASGAVAAALAIGMAGFAWQASIAQHERDAARQSQRAEAQQRQEAEAQRALAESQREVATQQAARATAINSFMQQMLLSADPELGGSRDVTVVQMLSKASGLASKSLKSQPRVEAAARTFLGNTFRSLGMVNESFTELNRALAMRSAGIESNTLAHAETLRALARLTEGTGDLTAASGYYQQALAILELPTVSAPGELTMAYCDMANILARLSQFPRAEEMLEKARAAYEKLPGRSNDILCSILDNRARLAEQWKGDLQEAESLTNQKLTLQRESGEITAVSDSLNSLATLKMKQSKLDEAEALFNESLQIERAHRGDQHPLTVVTLENLANISFSRKNYEKALEILKEVLSTREKLFGADSMPAARTRFNIGSVALAKNDYAAALPLIEGALPIFRKTMGEQNVDVAQVLRNRAVCRKGLGDLPGARQDLEDAMAIYGPITKPTFGPRLRTVQTLVEIRCLLGDAESARRLADEALAPLDATKPDQAKWISTIRSQVEACQPRPPG